MKFDTTKLENIDKFEQEFTSQLSKKIRIKLENQKSEISSDLLIQSNKQEEISGENS